MSNKKNIFKWNHISEDLPPDEITKLQNLYKHYHRLFKCYQWKYKKLRRLKLSLQLSSISLTVVGTITGSITLNPVVGGTVVGAGVIIQGYLAKQIYYKKLQNVGLPIHHMKKQWFN